MKRIIVGITGSFGTGKSAVAAGFKKLGACVIDADRLAHRAIKPGGACHRRVISAFGTARRRELARIVFSDRKKLKILNKLVHPYVIREIKRAIKKTKKKIIIIDAPLLIEAGLDKDLDRLIVVKASRLVQEARCAKKGFTKIDIRRRINCQLSLAKKERLADFIIDNNKSVSFTRAQIKKIWEEIKNGRH